MTLNPNKRPSIEDIMKHKWMQGTVPSSQEIISEFKARQITVNCMNFEE